MNNDYTLSVLRDALTQRKKMEDQVRKSIEPIMPTLRFIAEMQKVYRDVYGPIDELAEEEIVEAKPKAVAKPKTKKDVLFSKPKVTLPVGTTWADITVAFKNEHDIDVSYKDTHLDTYSYEELNFGKANTSWNKPNKLWALLRVLAVGEEYKTPQTIVFTKEHLMSICEVKTGNGVEKQKSDLAKNLRSVFGIQEEPFEPYSPELGYRPKFRLRPEPAMRGDGELHASAKQHFDIYSDD